MRYIWRGNFLLHYLSRDVAKAATFMDHVRTVSDENRKSRLVKGFRNGGRSSKTPAKAKRGLGEEIGGFLEGLHEPTTSDKVERKAEKRGKEAKLNAKQEIKNATPVWTRGS